MMRVGLVIYDSLDSVSGGYLYDRQLAGYLRGSGDDVEIVSLPRPAYKRCLTHNFRPSLAERLFHHGYDLLLQDELCHPSLYLLNERCARRTPIVSIVHHLRASERHPAHLMRRYQHIERRYLRAVDGFIFNSKTTRSAVRKLAGRMVPHAVIYPAADHVPRVSEAARLEVRATRDEPLKILFVGNVIPRKGLHLLTAALAHLPPNTWQLMIAGDTTGDVPYVTWLRAQMRQAIPQGSVSWFGRVADDELWQLMMASDLLVVPSSYEGFGIVYLEGMAFGLPAVATTAGGAHEFVTDGENGFLIEPGSVSELAARITLLQNDRRRLLAMSLAARSRFLAAPGWAQNMRRARDFLEEIVGR
ncbi:MAG: glycosyltransferase family 4 protein [Candidatus Promineifilaceae bacterium]